MKVSVGEAALIGLGVILSAAMALWGYASFVADDRSDDERVQEACEAEYENTVFDDVRAETYEADTFDEAVAECVADFQRMGATERDLWLEVYGD